MANKTRIGFDRTIRIEWLDAAAARIVNGDSPDVARERIWEFLEDVEPGTTNNSGRGKTLTVLTRIWISVPPKAERLKQAALKQLTSASGEQRTGIHWAMAVGTHPFFFDVVTHLGKLIKLNGLANRTQIKRRMTEAWGDRSTLERTIQHTLKSLTQWGLLQIGPEHGSLVAPSQQIHVDRNVSPLLLHAVLLGHGKGMAIAQLSDHPALFPFSFDLSARDLIQNPIFRVQRQGDQSDFVELA